MKCSNCSTDAVYVINDPGVSVVYYCNRCLPEPLKVRANAGQLDLPKEKTTEEPKKQPSKKNSGKTSEPASEPEAPDENPAS